MLPTMTVYLLRLYHHWKRLVTHLFLHDSLHGGKRVYFFIFLSDHLTSVLAHSSFELFSTRLVDSRKDKSLDGVQWN